MATSYALLSLKQRKLQLQMARETVKMRSTIYACYVAGGDAVFEHNQKLEVSRSLSIN